MSLVFGIPLLLALAAVQSSLQLHLLPLEAAPNLVMLAVVMWSLVASPAEAFAWALTGGLALDLLSGGPFGLNAVALMLVTFLTSSWEARFWRTHVLLPPAAVLAGSLLYHVMLLAALAALGRPVDWRTSIEQVTLPTTFFNAVLSLPAFYLAARFRHFLYPPPVEP